MTHETDIETVVVPQALSSLIERRTRGIMRASLHDANNLRTMAMSCYLQGLEDGYDAATSTRAPKESS